LRQTGRESRLADSRATVYSSRWSPVQSAMPREPWGVSVNGISPVWLVYSRLLFLRIGSLYRIWQGSRVNMIRA